jgi:hypothetical protein
VNSINKSQRMIVVTYCLLLAYCCLWVPWHVKLRYPQGASERAGYGWVWAGPYRSPDVVYNPPRKIPGTDAEILGEVDLDPSPLDAMPDFPRIALRIIATTSLFAAVFLAIGVLWKSATMS